MRRPAHVLSPRSLRGRLAWLVVFVTVPALALVAGLTKRAYDHERAAVGRHLLSTTRAVSLLVERKFEAAEALLHGFRAQPSLDQDDLTTFAAKIRPVLNNGDQWIVLLAPDGQQLINTRLPAGATLPVTQLGDDFWAAMRRGERFVSNVFTGTVVQAPVFSVSIPVLTPQGELKYALSFAMFPAALGRAIAAEQITAGDIVVILDRQGVIATRSRNVERFAGQPARPQLIAASAARPEGVLESVTLEGIPTLSAFSRCSSLGWVAAIGAPRAALYASARKLLTHAALWTLVLIALTATGAAWIGRAVVHGMDGLIADTQQVGAGAVPPERKSGLREIDVVGDALRSSAAQLTGHARELRQLNQTLEARVQARTRELDASNRALVSANRELEEFARVASHDLREPLRSMMAFTEMLRDEHGPRPTRKAGATWIAFTPPHAA